MLNNTICTIWLIDKQEWLSTLKRQTLTVEERDLLLFISQAAFSRPLPGSTGTEGSINIALQSSGKQPVKPDT